MILSMTGFGRGAASSSSKKIIVEIKSLNSKQLDLMMRIPPYFKEAEVAARQIVAAKLERGKVELNAISEFIGKDAPVNINVPLLKIYKNQIEQLAQTLEIPKPENWYNVLLRMPDAMKADAGNLDKEDADAFVKAVESACDALVKFRIDEGRKLYSFFAEKIENISNLLESVTPYEKERVPKIKQRLEEQLSRLSSIEFDPGRLEQELVFYIEKLDVTEEKTRLRSHLTYFMETMGQPDSGDYDGGKGKKLGFIAQEMGREINTLGSKANHAEMQKIVVKMKDELEQIKEQVLNVL